MQNLISRWYCNLWCSLVLPEGLVSWKYLRYFKIFYPRNILRKFCLSEWNPFFCSWLANAPIFVVSLKIGFYDMSSFQMPKASLDTYHTPQTNLGHSFLVGCGTEHWRLYHCQPAVEPTQIMACIGWGEQWKVGHSQLWAMQIHPLFYHDI